MRVKYPVLAPIAVALFAQPAAAALVSTYGMTDDVWATPLSPGKALIDARAIYNYTAAGPDVLTLPGASLVFGLPANWEVGVSGQYNLPVSHTGGQTSAPGIANPYLKVQLPWSPGGTVFGLVGGVQIPTQSQMEHNIAVEAVAAIPLASAWSLDLNLGAGRTFVAPATLGHGSASIYCTLATGQSFVLEGGTYLTSDAPVAYVEHVGFLQPISSQWSADLSVAADEQAATTGYVPQLGTTLIF